MQAENNNVIKNCATPQTSQHALISYKKLQRDPTYCALCDFVVYCDGRFYQKTYNVFFQISFHYIMTHNVNTFCEAFETIFLAIQFSVSYRFMLNELLDIFRPIKRYMPRLLHWLQNSTVTLFFYFCNFRNTFASNQLEDIFIRL